MKSMNGVITYDDGQGTVISNGTINTQTLDVQTLNTQNIVAPDPGADSSLYVDDITDVYLASNCSTLHARTLSLNTFGTEYGTTEFMQYDTASNAIALFTNCDNAILLGSSTSPIISDYTCVNDYELANKGYVDAAVAGGGSGGASLTATQTFTGVNTFDNDTNIGKTDETSTVNIYGEVNIGNNTISPGADTQIYGDVITIQGLSSTNLISNKTTFGNSGTPSNASVDIGTSGEVDINFNTYSGDRSIRTAQIKTTGGNTATDSGDLVMTAKNITQGASSVMYFNGSDIRLGDPSYLSLIRLRGGFEIGDGLNIPPAEGYIYGNNIYTSARASMSGSTPKFSITNYGSITSSFNVNTTTANEIDVEFNTNPSLLSQITSKIVATGTGLLAGALAFTSGAISFSATTFSILANTGITLSSVIASFVNLAATQYIDIDPSSSPPSIKYRSNTSNPSLITATINGSSASATNAGTITLNSNIATVQSQSGSGSFSIDATTSPIIYLDFKTNVAAPTTNMASIYVNGGTTANTGTMSMTSGILDFYAPTNRLTNNANLYGDTGDGVGEYVPMWVGNCMTKVTAAATFTAQNTAWHTFLCIPYSNTTAFTITLSNTGIRDCVPFYIYNAGAATITVTASNTFRLIGPGLTRGGQTNITLLAGDGKMFRWVKNLSAGFMSDATRTYGIYVQ